MRRDFFRPPHFRCLRGFEDEKIIHSVGFDEIVLIDERKSGFFQFFDDDGLIDSVIVAVAVAVNNSD